MKLAAAVKQYLSLPSDALITEYKKLTQQDKADLRQMFIDAGVPIED